MSWMLGVHNCHKDSKIYRSVNEQWKGEVAVISTKCFRGRLSQHYIIFEACTAYTLHDLSGMSIRLVTGVEFDLYVAMVVLMQISRWTTASVTEEGAASCYILLPMALA